MFESASLKLKFYNKVLSTCVLAALVLSINCSKDSKESKEIVSL